MKGFCSKSKNTAFTMMELVFVIVVAGIIAATVVPRFDKNNLQEAADQVISHLRYTKHLAMIDDRFDEKNATWFKSRWQLVFSRTVDSKVAWSYTIFSDKINHDKNPNISDTIARNPINTNQFLSGGYSGILPLNDDNVTSSMTLADKYGIKRVQFSKSCSNNTGIYQSRRVIFDSMGRAYWGYQADSSSTGSNPYKDMYLIRQRCEIALCLSDPCNDNNLTIAIEPETGYIHLI